MWLWKQKSASCPPKFESEKHFSDCMIFQLLWIIIPGWTYNVFPLNFYLKNATTFWHEIFTGLFYCLYIDRIKTTKWLKKKPGILSVQPFANLCGFSSCFVSLINYFSNKNLHLLQAWYLAVVCVRKLILFSVNRTLMAWNFKRKLPSK